MVDAGPRVAIALWCTSIAVHVAYLIGFVNWTFMTVWSLTSLIDKSLKLVSRRFELEFQDWTNRVWNSFSCRDGNDNNGETELPVFVRPRS